jgi:uncharacterized protein
VTFLPLFVNSKYELRSGWRVLAFSSVFIVLYIVWATILGMIVAWIFPALSPAASPDMRSIGVFAIAVLPPILAALVIIGRLVDHVPLSVFGITLHDRWLRDFGIGLALAAAMLGLTLVGSFLFGTVRMELGSMQSAPAIGGALAVLAVAAVNEELLFRGYPLQVLMKGIGLWGATLLISSLFGLLHWWNPDATILGVVNTILAGVLLSLAYWKTRSLWLPYGIHVGWNTGLAVVLGFPVSGLQTASVLKTSVSGSQMILGGNYGPEGGILGTVCLLTAAIVVYRMRVAVSPQLRATLLAHAGKVYVEDL